MSWVFVTCNQIILSTLPHPHCYLNRSPQIPGWESLTKHHRNHRNVCVASVPFKLLCNSNLVLNSLGHWFTFIEYLPCTKLSCDLREAKWLCQLPPLSQTDRTTKRRAEEGQNLLKETSYNRKLHKREFPETGLEGIKWVTVVLD